MIVQQELWGLWPPCFKHLQTAWGAIWVPLLNALYCTVSHPTLGLTFFMLRILGGICWLFLKNLKCF